MSALKLLVALIVSLCLSGCCPDLDKDKIKNELDASLQVGDSREKVEKVLKAHGIEFGYDGEFEQRYSANIVGKGCAFDKSVIVYIYMDKLGGMSRIETSDSYTFL
jgi:hypothetical protein